ncbi:flagellin [Paraburkholderia sp.]|uniref:flagellin n=1 Tax=Paraburkholderia sp. TaxID=1926495 RepID=UPI002F3F5CD2
MASGKVSSDYAGIGNKTAMLEAARSASSRTDAYQSVTQAALNQVDLQDTQLTAVSGLADQLRQAVTKAVADNDATTLMANAGGIFEQLKQILNSQDADGNYIYGGNKDNTPPVTANSISDLSSLSSASDAFANGHVARSVTVADGETVKIGVLASDVGQQLMQALKDVADFNAGPNGGFGTGLTQAQANFLSGEIGSATAASQNINNLAAVNGQTYAQLQDASDRQQSMSTLYKGFVSDLEDVDMGEAISRLNQNQVALQAALQVTSQLHQISLLNYLPASGTPG